MYINYSGQMRIDQPNKRPAAAKFYLFCKVQPLTGYNVDVSPLTFPLLSPFVPAKATNDSRYVLLAFPPNEMLTIMQLLMAAVKALCANSVSICL